MMGVDAVSEARHRLAREIEGDRVTEILRIADEAARADSPTPPRAGDLVWYSLREAFDTLNRLPDRETGWLYSMRSAFPEYVHDYKERLELWEETLQRLKLGEKVLSPIRSAPPSARAISRMEYVFGWHRHLQGARRARDWKIVGLMASGYKAGLVARQTHCSRRTVYHVREWQTGAIATGLKSAYGLTFPVT